MSIYSDIESLFNHVVGGYDVFYDGLPDHPINSISIDVESGDLLRRSGAKTWTKFYIRIKCRDALPGNARDTLKIIIDLISETVNFSAGGSNFQSIFSTNVPRLHYRGTGGDSTYVVAFDIIWREG